MKPKNYSKDDILSATMIGVEFEFYSKLQGKDVARSIAKEIGKRVVIPYAVPPLGNKPKPLYHSPIEVTGNIFKLEPDYSGGVDMFELVTGPLPYDEAKTVITKILNWIDRYGYTTERCSIHVNMSFDTNKVEPVNSVDKLEVLKFVLSFDEKFVYDRFPTREFSVYARSIKSIIPNSFFFYSSPPADFSVASQLNVPEEKYFGINFLKREKNYLEFRYLGGKDYEKKTKKIFDCIDHFSLSFFDVINSVDYTEAEKNAIRKIYNEQRENVAVFNDYAKFKEAYPDIEISVDLKNDDQVIKTFWTKLRNDIFSLVVDSGMKKGRYNYDSDYGIKQLAKVDLTRAILRNYELIDCKVEGIISNCELYFCDIKESRLTDCIALKENVFDNCKLQQIMLHPTNHVKNCYIENKNLIINCKVDGGVIRNGEIGALAEISEETKIVETVNPVDAAAAPTAEQKEKMEKPKDWEWIKSLKKNDKK